MESKSKRIATTIPAPEAIRQQLLRIVRTSHHKLTPIALEAAVRDLLPVNRKSVRAAVRDLVATRELVYTNQYGCSFLETSFNRPVRIAGRLVVKPAANRYRAKAGDIVVSLAAGSAFGTGEHPTTRLAVQAMEYILSLHDPIRAGINSPAAVLDVGTGSGVLVIAAVKLGLKRGVGIDTDPCARVEARENVRLNRLQDRIVISNQAVGMLSGSYFMVTANLRCPSLCQLAECMCELTEAGGCLVLSGFRPDEMGRVKSVYTELGFKDQWQGIELGWAGMAFHK